MEEKYKAANKVLLDLRAQVEQLERAGENSSMGLQSQISININTLSKFTTELENMVPQQAAMRREIWRIRVQSLAEECRDLRESMGSYLQKRHVKAVEEEQRRELFEGRRRRAVGTGLESLYKEQESLGRSHHIADNIKDMGESILHNLGTQNDLLKNAHRKILDMANTLNLSRSIMRVIERRQFMDQLLVYGGMVFVVLFLFVLWYFFM
ncbi:Golgi SNAP receptor complex member 2 [Balamuthia mandrillaris]